MNTQIENPEVAAEATPEVTPEVTPEATPEIAPEVAPEVVPEATPEATPEAKPEQPALPYTHCLNCGTELKGTYCHNCGQEAVSKTPTVGSFIFEYFDHAFKWDHKFFSTFWTLISRPGKLTKEYNAGKFVSQEHPLKLNMFLLLIFVMMFAFFAGEEKINEPVHSMIKDERFYASFQLDALSEDAEYAKKMEQSPRDTVLLQAPLFLTESYPQVLSNIETVVESNEEANDRWMAVLPQVLIEDKILVPDESGCYRFNTEKELASDDWSVLASVWEEVSAIIMHYFPILLLLTVPFLSFSVRLVQRRSNLPGMHHYVFALHYTAFLETLMILCFILHLTVDPSMMMMEAGIKICSFIYLILAFRRVYETSWWKAVIKALMTNLVYSFIIIMALIMIVIVAIIVAATKM